MGDARTRPGDGTRQRLQRTALELFSRQGFDAVRVADITEACGVSERTFFRHFATKEDVLLADHGARLSRLEQALAHRPADESAAASIVAAVTEVAAEYVSARADLVVQSRLLEETPSLRARSMELQTQWERVIAAAITDRVGDDLEAEALGASAVACLRVAVRYWRAASRDEDLPDIVRRALGVVQDIRCLEPR
jgi:TetR/AcrR family transcriptional regulator, regulator of mycofactocin system